MRFQRRHFSRVFVNRAVDDLAEALCEANLTIRTGSTSTPINVASDGPLFAGADQALSNLLCYLSSWRTEKGLAGAIATWWSSAIDAIEPHPMNQAPLIQLLVRLNELGVKGDWLSWADLEATSLLESIDGSGLLRNGWGDLPGRPLAPVIGFSGAGALIAIASRTKSSTYLDAADRILKGYEARFANGTQLYHEVANQSARWALVLLQRYIATGDEANLDKAHRILRHISREVVSKGRFAGGIHQGGNDDTLINVYVGKCLYPIFAVSEFTGDQDLRELGLETAHYLCRHAIDERGALTNYFEPSGPLYGPARIASSLSRRIFGASRNLRELRRSAIVTWKAARYPIFVARSADTIRGLRIAAGFDSQLKSKVQLSTRFLLSNQNSDGGFLNSILFSGERGGFQWQDFISSNRWNVYAAQLLTDMLQVELGQNTELPEPTIRWGREAQLNLNDIAYRISEDEAKVEAWKCDSSQEALSWTMHKRQGTVDVIDTAWSGELTGPRQIRNLGGLA